MDNNVTDATAEKILSQQRNLNPFHALSVERTRIRALFSPLFSVKMNLHLFPIFVKIKSKKVLIISKLIPI